MISKEGTCITVSVDSSIMNCSPDYNRCANCLQWHDPDSSYLEETPKFACVEEPNSPYLNYLTQDCDYPGYSQEFLDDLNRIEIILKVITFLHDEWDKRYSRAFYSQELLYSKLFANTLDWAHGKIYKKWRK